MGLIERLSDEADLCRNDGADDIAALLDEAVSALELVDDYIARCEGNDRGSCEAVNVLRRAIGRCAAVCLTAAGGNADDFCAMTLGECAITTPAPRAEAAAPLNPRLLRKVIAEHVDPSIKAISFNWTATFEGYKPGDSLGTGKTEQEAIDWLIAEEAHLIAMEHRSDES